MSQWADELGYLITGTGRSRRWKTREPQRAVLDAFSQPEIREINLLKSARFGWTSILMQAMGYFIDQDPSPILMVQPRGKDMEEWSKEQIQPTIDANPALSALVPAHRQGSGSNTIDMKEYPGGPLRLRASNSPDGFRRYGARVAMCDEIDAYPLASGKEGDISGLIESRVQDAWNYIVANGSTPTEADISRIDGQVKRASLGYPFLACPHCDEPHIRLFEKEDGPIVLRGSEQPISYISWHEGDPKSARYVCQSCGAAIEQRNHRKMLDACYWIGEHWEYTDRKYKFLPGFDGRIAFATWAGYVISPNTTPEKLVARYERSKGDQEELKTFVNTVKGQAWKETGEELSAERLYARCEKYAAEVPKGVKFLTAGIDVQGNRWEMEVVGWGDYEESWSIDYQVIMGDTSQDDDWWHILRPFLLDTYQHENGFAMPIGAIGIDHGFMGKRVDKFLKQLNHPRAWAFRGRGGDGVPFVETANQRRKRISARKRGHSRPEMLGDTEAKLTTLKRLRVNEPGAGYAHFPMEREKAYFSMLASEKLVTRYKHGRPSREWVMLQTRNEALDCRKIAHAALLLCNIELAEVTNEPDTKQSKPKKNIQLGAPRGGLVR